MHLYTLLLHEKIHLFKYNFDDIIVMSLGTIEIADGLFSLIFVIVSILIGIIIASKYFKHKKIELLMVGLAWIGVSSPYWPSSISIVLILTTNTKISFELYLFLMIFFVPIFFTFWVLAFSKLVLRKGKLLFITIYVVEAVLFEIFFLIVLFTNPQTLGEVVNPVNMKIKSFAAIWMLIHVFFFLITGLLFARESLRSQKPETRLKGKFLIIAFISWTIGTSLDALNPIGFINRIILIISAFSFYFGFILPNWLKNSLLKIKIVKIHSIHSKITLFLRVPIFSIVISIRSPG